MVNEIPSESLMPIDTFDFLPSTNRWVATGGWLILLFLSGALAVSFFVKYSITVKAPAMVRPAGEPRLVQSPVAGTVASVHGTENTYVEEGEVIARLDVSSLEARAAQLLANLITGEDRLTQIDAQMATVDRQKAAETEQSRGAVAAAIADYDAGLRAYQNQKTAAEAAVREAQLQMEFLAKEVDSLRLLLASGAMSRLQLDAKQAELEAARARMTTLQAALNPSLGSVTSAQQRTAQLRARGLATLARLDQSKEQLVEQKLEIIEQLEAIKHEITQVDLDLINAVVRSPISGTLYDVNLRNINQIVNSGETLAKVIPANTPIVIKARLPSEQISKIEINLPVKVQIAACPFAEFGTISGYVSGISPDASTTDAQSSQPSDFYSVMIEVDRSALSSRAGKPCKLLPGMNAQATIISHRETIMTFLRRRIGGFG